MCKHVLKKFIEQKQFAELQLNVEVKSDGITKSIKCEKNA